MKKMIFSVVAVLVLVFGAGGAAWGALLEKPFGDVANLLTFDEETGLEWLDLDQTVGMSYNSVQGSAYMKDHNFRYATDIDLANLYLHTYADPNDVHSDGTRYSEIFLGMRSDREDVNLINYHENYHEVDMLLRLMSVTMTDGAYQAVLGLFLYASEEGGRLDASYVALNNDDNLAVMSISDNPYDPLPETTNQAYASYLVRDASAVPLPGAVFFLGSGVIALIGAKRRFKK